MTTPSAADGLVDELLPRCAFPAAGTAVSCAVSGGPDSTALLVLACAAGLEVTAWHVDHGVRPGSATEAERVRGFAYRFGAAVETRRVEAEDGPNFEARARDARRAVLPDDVMTGHTLDDQAETVLLFMLRGTGPEGLAGIGEPQRRPLLGLRRAETRRLCAELGLSVVADPMNDDPRFVRNRVRRELLALMEDIAGRDVAPLIARAAALQHEVLDVVAAEASTLDPTDARAVAAVAATSPAVAAAAMRSWWRSETGWAYAPDAAALARMLDVAAGGAVATDVTGGWRVERTDQRLRLVAPLGADGGAR